VVSGVSDSTISLSLVRQDVVAEQVLHVPEFLPNAARNSVRYIAEIRDERARGSLFEFSIPQQGERTEKLRVFVCLTSFLQDIQQGAVPFSEIRDCQDDVSELPDHVRSVQEQSDGSELADSYVIEHSEQLDLLSKSKQVLSNRSGTQQARDFAERSISRDRRMQQ